ncbi:MAG: hypothetical protein ACYDEX_12785 [Mobilitalea sp.]
MNRRYDILHAIILILFLVVANFVDNTTLKGVLLFLFSTVLIINTVMKLKMIKDDKFKRKFFYGILLFLEVMLAVGSIFVMVFSFIAT